jgi:hypothetical protein
VAGAGFHHRSAVSAEYLNVSLGGDQPPFFLAILQLYGMMLVEKYNGELIV